MPLVMSFIRLHLQAHWLQQHQQTCLVQTQSCSSLLVHGLRLLEQRKLNTWLLLAAAAVVGVIALAEVLMAAVQAQEAIELQQDLPLRLELLTPLLLVAVELVVLEVGLLVVSMEALEVILFFQLSHLQVVDTVEAGITPQLQIMVVQVALAVVLVVQHLVALILAEQELLDKEIMVAPILLVVMLAQAADQVLPHLAQRPVLERHPQ
jgi:hypothetical protein